MKVEFSAFPKAFSGNVAVFVAADKQLLPTAKTIDADSGGGPESSAAVNAPHLVTPADSEVVIPISVHGAANKGIISYEFDLRYDPSVIQPQVNPVDLAGTVSSR